jgi:ribonuclease T2
MKVSGVAFLLAAAVAPVCAPALAAGDCILDNCADQRPMPNTQPAQQPMPQAQPLPQAAAPADGGYFRRGAGAPSGDFDFYLLSLSWSPSFCASGGAERSGSQCAPGANPGFVLHGLWPNQFNGYAPPCSSDGFLPYSVLNGLVDLYPDLGLAKHEWRAHGACSGKPPSGYFADVRAARASVAIPAALRAPTGDLTLSPQQVQQAFFDANPRLRPGMMAVTCPRGMMQEVRICLSKDLRGFVACPQTARSSCRNPSIVVPAGR